MIVVPHTPPPASARSRALADALKATIADFRRREPKLTDAEIEAALARAHESIHARDVRKRRALVGVLAGLACGLGAMIVAASNAGGLARDSSVAALAAGGIVLVGVVVALLLRSINNS